MSRTIGELMESVDGASGKLAKAQLIKDNATNNVVEFLRLAYGNKNWAYKNRPLPELKLQDPPHGLSENNLSNELRRMYIFEEGFNITDRKRDQILIQMVESFSKKEAELVIAMVTGDKIPVRGLTQKLVDDLFSGKA